VLNIFPLMRIGLGVGAMFVRSLTTKLVEPQTLTSYCYLEHGAFYAIIALAVMMFISALEPIPELSQDWLEQDSLSRPLSIPSASTAASETRNGLGHTDGLDPATREKGRQFLTRR
jgi:hypothetical protein